MSKKKTLYREVSLDEGGCKPDATALLAIKPVTNQDGPYDTAEFNCVNTLCTVAALTVGLGCTFEHHPPESFRCPLCGDKLELRGFVTNSLLMPAIEYAWN
jgi:hypothetical protein